jgi:superfamily II DNA or RNA helicase
MATASSTSHPLDVNITDKEGNVHSVILSAIIHKTYRLPHFYGRKLSSRIASDSIKDSGFEFVGTLRDSQALIVPKVISALHSQRSAILSLETGGGKTITAIYIAHKLQRKCAIVVHRLCLLQQWVDAIQKVCPNATIHLPNTKNKHIDDTFDFTIIMVGNIHKFSNWNHIGTVLVDECHAIMTQNHIFQLLHFTPKYLLGLSATPQKCPEIRDYFYSSIISLPKEAPFIVKYIPTEYKYFHKYIERAGGKNTIDWNDILNQQSTNKSRNEMLINLIQSIVNSNPKRYVLAMVKRVEHAKLLQEAIPNSSTYLSSDKTYNDEARVLIGTYSKMGIGFDHPKINTIILCADLAESISVEQAIGRAKRKIDLENLPWIYDIVDNNNIMKSHYKQRLKVYQSLNGVIEDDNNHTKEETSSSNNKPTNILGSKYTIDD